MGDIERHLLLGEEERSGARESSGIPGEATVIAIISRPSPEKGLDIALESVSQAVSALPAEQAAGVRVIIAGDGPGRQGLEERVRQLGLTRTCVFWGNITSLIASNEGTLSDGMFPQNTQVGVKPS